MFHKAFINVSDFHNISQEFLKQFEARHMLVHMGAEEKVYKCKHCDLVFSQRILLINHERSLTGDKPFTCNTCSKVNSEERISTNYMSDHCFF